MDFSVTPRPVESYALTRNQSEGSILRNKETANENDEDEEEDVDEENGAMANNDNDKLPTSYQQKEGNRAYTNAAKSVDNMFKSSDLGYASDVCDYNVSKNKKEQQQQVPREQQSFSRPVSQLVSPHLKPTSPRLESSLYARRMRLIRKRASVFGGSNEDNNDSNDYFNHPTNHYDNLCHAGKSTSSAVPRHGVMQTPPVITL